MSADQLWADFFSRPGKDWDTLFAKLDAVDPVDSEHARAVAPAPLWWLGVARRMQAWRDAQQQVKLAA